MTVCQIYKRMLTVAAISCTLVSVCQAEKLDEVVHDAISNSPAILMSSAAKYAQANKLREVVGGYFPKVDLAAAFGRDYNKNYFTRLEIGPPSSLTLSKREASLSIKQMLFDGYAIRSDVEANSARDKSQGYQVLAQTENVILQVTAAYIDTIMLRSIYMHAKDNLNYLQQLLEDLDNEHIPNVVAGDIEYVQGRVFLAQTAMLDLQRDIRNSQADYIKVVGKKPGIMYRPESPEKNIPNNEEAAVSMSTTTNPLIFIGNADIQAARAEKRGSKSHYFPQFDLELYGSNNKNVEGITQTTHELSAMLQMKYNLFRGGRDMAHERKTAWLLEESKQALNETLRTVEQNARHAWSNYVNYKGQLGYLRQRVDNMQQTRDAYRKEFADGTRPVKDVLEAAEELYLAKANYVNAQYKDVLSRFMVLHSVGKLREHFRVSAPASVQFKSSFWFNGY